MSFLTGRNMVGDIPKTCQVIFGTLVEKGALFYKQKDNYKSTSLLPSATPKLYGVKMQNKG